MGANTLGTDGHSGPGRAALYPKGILAIQGPSLESDLSVLPVKSLMGSWIEAMIWFSEQWSQCQLSRTKMTRRLKVSGPGY